MELSALITHDADIFEKLKKTEVQEALAQIVGVFAAQKYLERHRLGSLTITALQQVATLSYEGENPSIDWKNLWQEVEAAADNLSHAFMACTVACRLHAAIVEILPSGEVTEEQFNACRESLAQGILETVCEMSDVIASFDLDAAKQLEQNVLDQL